MRPDQPRTGLEIVVHAPTPGRAFEAAADALMAEGIERGFVSGGSLSAPSAQALDFAERVRLARTERPRTTRRARAVRFLRGR